MHRKTVVDTAYGAVQGFYTGSCLLFAGIPYAAAPTGERRFRPPEAPEPWAGVRDATHFGPMQPQTPSRFRVFMGPDPHPQSEDSLLLNVWTPAADDARRPVLVFLHGGAWVSGSGSLPMYRGAAFAARHDLVCVTLNYRLGEAGGLYLGHRDAGFAASGNTALLDQIAALTWVRDHIAAFGGDAANVTLCGQSAGANATAALMAAPRAAGLFHRAICQSPSYFVRQKNEAIETTEHWLRLVSTQDIGDLQRLPVETLLAARGELMRQRVRPPRLSIWGAVIDDGVLHVHPLEAAMAGGVVPVPLLIGACHDDYRPYLYLMPPGTVPQDDAAVGRFFDGLGVDGGRTVEVYRRELGPTVAASDVFAAAMTDYRFRQPSIALAERHAGHQPTFLYDFRWASPVLDGALGAGHTVDIPFAFHTLWTPCTPYHLGDDPPVALADSMHAAWSAFARSGQPATDLLPMWPAYDVHTRATMALETPATCVSDPGAALRTYWAGRPGVTA
jgi:para-nitrobenzyl esterase